MLSSLLVTYPAFALETAPTNILSSPDQVVGDFCAALNWLFWGLIVLSVAMFLVGGYRYVTSGGEAERVSSANRTLLYAAIGVVVALVAAGTPSLINNFLTGGSLTGACGSSNNGGYPGQYGGA